MSTISLSATTIQNFGQGTVSVNDGNTAFSLFDLRRNPQATTYNISDDGVTGSILLPFSFTFFDRIFNEAYMYSNGVLGFDLPTWQNFCCDGSLLNSQMSNEFNYKIMPLWTDLIGGEGTFYSLAKPNYMIFGWYDIAEYGTSNLNNFEIRLNDDNTFDIIYGDINVQSHNVTIGITGNLSANQFYQYFTGSGGNLITSNTSLSIQFQADPCVDNPLYSTTCPGYQQAYFEYQCSINSLYNVQCNGYAEALALQNLEIDIETIRTIDTNTSYNDSIIQTEPVTNSGMIGDSTSTYNNVRSDAGGISVNTNGSIVVENGIPDVAKLTQETAGIINLTTSDEKIMNSLDVINKPISNNESKKVTSPSLFSSNTINKIFQKNEDNGIDNGLEYINMYNDNIVASFNYSSGISYNSNPHIFGHDIGANEVIEEKQSSISVFSPIHNAEQKEELGFQKDLIDELIKSSNQIKKEEKNELEVTNFSINKDNKENDIANEGPAIEDLNKFGPQIDSYLKENIKDIAFYKEKAFYKNQKTIDNQKILRVINYQNDLTFDKMIKEQYK